MMIDINTKGVRIDRREDTGRSSGAFHSQESGQCVGTRQRG